MEHLTGRRSFLARAGSGLAALGTGPVWSWASENHGPPASARKADKFVAIPTLEHFGDKEERLEIPEGWDLTVQRMAGHNEPVLTPTQIRQRIEQPIATKRLSELAAGKKTVVITFDDLTRPTPAFEIVPHVIAELKQGGIKDENIMFLGSFGSHCLMRQTDVRAKLGWEIVQKYPWVNHNCWENLVDVGQTSRGNRIKVDQHFAKADLRVTVSGVKMHGQAGYGGGGKAVLPGVAWIDSIDYNHNKIGGRGNKTQGACKIFKNEVRLDMVEAARLANAEFSVQAVYNGYRKLIGIYAGDIEKAHHEACRHANRALRTEPVMETDIAIANGSPCAIHAYGYVSWLRNIREGGSVVLIAQHPYALEAMHYLTERQRYQPDKTYFEMADSEGFNVKQSGLFIIYSSYAQARDVRRFQKGALVTRSWADTVAALRKAHPSGARAVLYPYAGIQHRPIDLDG